MTKEEAIKYIKQHCIPNYPKTDNTQWEEAMAKAIKALEQEPILDKIEKEINSPNRGTCDYFIVDRIEEIIGKYKAESKEGAENDK